MDQQQAQQLAQQFIDALHTLLNRRHVSNIDALVELLSDDARLTTPHSSSPAGRTGKDGKRANEPAHL